MGDSSGREEARGYRGRAGRGAESGRCVCCGPKPLASCQSVFPKMLFDYSVEDSIYVCGGHGRSVCALAASGSVAVVQAEMQSVARLTFQSEILYLGPE